MIIVAGHLQVTSARRADYLDACLGVIELARASPGCLDFALSADLLEPGRINVFERWTSVEHVEAFRGEAPQGPDPDAIVGAEVEQYEVRTSLRL
jgi:quinol monooxygenase YgiN